MKETKMNGDYHFSLSETSIYVEILLPKRSHLQAALYDTLTAGFISDNIKKHFEENKSEIELLLREYKRLKTRLDNLNVDKIPVLRGYSMYEVDGVFKGNAEEVIRGELEGVIKGEVEGIIRGEVDGKFKDDVSGKLKGNKLNVPIEERTQVIRIILMPEIKE